uniref:Uncharacterized protein n=1 Tax=Oncorhynchus kisutch TaxID=8019 RepID=A0A8C7K038_ONCKI
MFCATMLCCHVLLPCYVVVLVQLKIHVTESSDKITLSRVDGFTFSPNNETTHILDYKDENTGEFVCKKDGREDRKIYVKGRTCDECIKLDTDTAVGMVVGLFTTSDKMGLIHNEASVNKITCPQ